MNSGGKEEELPATGNRPKFRVYGSKFRVNGPKTCVKRQKFCVGGPKTCVDGLKSAGDGPKTCDRRLVAGEKTKNYASTSAKTIFFAPSAENTRRRESHLMKVL
jgi:hypothetical protein